AVGNLSGTAFARIAGHVEDCQVCEAILQTFDHLSDGLVFGLSKLKSLEEKDGEAFPQDLLTVAREALVAPANGTPPEISIDFGRHFARQLAAGNRRLGKFELQAELGSGSFGYVFRAYDQELDRTVAVKIPRAGSMAEGEEASRFLREARS